MYKSIEKEYKKNSPYNIIKKRVFLIYIIFISVAWVFNFLDKIIPMILIFISLPIVMKIISERVLKTKLYFKIRKLSEGGQDLSTIIREEERKLFKVYLISNQMYNENALLCIINHYRSVIKTKIIGGNLVAILSLVVPIILAFYTENGFDFMGLTNALPYLICFCIIIVLLYFIFKRFIEIKDFIKGEDGMLERLEEIFSELYIECINESKAVINKENLKRQKKKSKKHP